MGDNELSKRFDITFINKGMDMRTISEYNQEQLLSITDEDIEKVIDFQCALEGVPLLPERPVEPTKLEIAPDVTVYEVAGFVFKEKESAEIVQQAINGQVMVKIDYDYNLGYDYKYVTSVNDNAAAIAANKYLSLAAFDEAKSEIAKYTAEYKQFDGLNKIYQDVSSQRQDIADRVWNAVYDARRIRDDKLNAMKRFERYVGMADGDKELANKFFADAYPDDVHLLISEEA
jgi:hypothetical protein